MNRIYKWLLGSPVSRTAAPKPQRSVLGVHQMEDRVVPSAVLYRDGFGNGVEPDTIATGLSYEWKGPNGALTATAPSTEQFKGEFGNEEVTFVLRGLTPGLATTVSFDLYVIRSWDGNNETYGGTSNGGNGDRWTFKANGTQIVDTTFRNWATVDESDDDQKQNYGPDSVNNAMTWAAETGTLGYPHVNRTDVDSVYRLTETVVANSNGKVVLKFAANGLQGLNDESWGLDNVLVTADVNTVSVEPMDSTIGEGDGASTFRIFLDAEPTGPTSVHYNTRGITATDGYDFTSTSGSVTFIPGQSPLDEYGRPYADIAVFINDDGLSPEAELLESFEFFLYDPTNVYLGASVAETFIVDNDFVQIGGFVWADTASAGIAGQYDPAYGEAGHAGIVVGLFDAYQGFVADTVTGADGSFLFDNLPGGTYQVRVYPPLDQQLTVKDAAGVSESDDSDVDPNTGLTDPITLLGTNVADLLIGGGLVMAAPPAQPNGPAVIITRADGQAVNDLKVAKWHDAFGLTLTATGDLVAKIRGANDAGHDFIDRDNDRFNVRVYNLAEWNAGTATVDVTLSTTNTAGFTAYDDAATTLRLVRMAEPEGWYWSDSQILVSNKIDDDYTDANVGVDEAGPAVAVNTKNNYSIPVTDRTHLIALGGTVKVEYNTGNAAIGQNGVITTTATPAVQKVVKVHVTILRNKALADGGEGVVKAEIAAADLLRANEQYAQVGIRLVGTFQTIDPPAGVDLSNGLAEFTRVDAAGDVVLTAEEVALMVPANRTAALDDIELYYVNYLSGTSRGEAVHFSTAPAPRFEDSVIISADAMAAVPGRERFVVAHEIGHILLDAGHVTDVLGIFVNLMKKGTDFEDGSVLASKRLTEPQGEDILTKRLNLLSNP